MKQVLAVAVLGVCFGLSFFPTEQSFGHGTGQTGMPAFSQIELLDRWHLVNFIFDLQKTEKPNAHPH